MSNEVLKSNCYTIRSHTTQDEKLFEGHGIELLPVEGKLFSFRGEGVIPVLETVRCVLLEVLSKVLEFFEDNESLNLVPCKSRKPFESIFNSGFRCAFYKEIHFCVFIEDFNLLFLHQTEGDKSEEDQLMSFEETSRDPLINSVSYIKDETWNTFFTFFCCPINGLQEEEDK